jgi:4-hydroxyphenylpyruvate dioxygenase
MEFNHLHLFVDNVALWRDRFVHTWGGQATDWSTPAGALGVLVHLGQVPILITAPQTQGDAVATYLTQHPAGLGDVAFRVTNLAHTLDQVRQAGGQVLTPVQTDDQGRGCWGQIQGWGTLRHTLVQSDQVETWVPGQPVGETVGRPTDSSTRFINQIDHAVLNVPPGQLTDAVNWYVSQLGFQPQQQFNIDTAWSGLRSQVLAHPHGRAQLPINEPATPNSQVQEFLDWNCGAGIQHVALHTRDILQTVQQLKQAGVTFLEVPDRYYTALPQRQGYEADAPLEAAIARLKILVDWETPLPQARLLQTFTQPFLDIPTLFFEIIQRQSVHLNGVKQCAQGFGERNFQALFEAIEQEQRKRGSLLPHHHGQPAS